MADDTAEAIFAAEDDQIDFGALVRVGAWGIAAAAALAVAVAAGQSDIGGQRIGSAVGSLRLPGSRPPAAPQPARSDADEHKGEIRELLEAVHALSVERDRMARRIAAIEHSLDDLTGSISRLPSRTGAPAATLSTAAGSAPSDPPTIATSSDATRAKAMDTSAPKVAGPSPTLPPPAPPAALLAAGEAPAPRIVSVDATPAPTAQAPITQAPLAQPLAAQVPVAAAPRGQAAAPLAPGVEIATTQALPAQALPAQAPSTQAPTTRLVAPDPARIVSQPLPPPPAPARDVTTDRADASADNPGIDSVATRTEFGLDVGGATTVQGLRVIWGLLKSKHPALVDGLRPVVAVRDSGRPGGLQLRLIVGPLADAAAAARLCAILASTGRLCETALFDGQRLMLR